MSSRLDVLLQFYAEDPQDEFTRFALAQEYLKRGETSEALELMEALVTDAPNYIGTYYHLGKLYEDLGRDDEARTTYQQGSQRAFDHRDFHAHAELQGALQNLTLGLDDA